LETHIGVKTKMAIKTRAWLLFNPVPLVPNTCEFAQALLSDFQF